MSMTVTAEQLSEFLEGKDMRVLEVKHMRTSKSFAFVLSYTDEAGQDWLVHVCPPTKKVSGSARAITVHTMEVERDHGAGAGAGSGGGLESLFKR